MDAANVLFVIGICQCFLIIIGVMSDDGDLQCITCTNTRDFHDCLNNTVICSKQELCYFDQILHGESDWLYSAGCRSRALCGLFTDHTSDHESCTQCCGEDGLCNQHLCGWSRNDTIDHACVTCDGLVTSIAECQTLATCAEHERCSNGVHVVKGKLLYSFTCTNATLCDVQKTAAMAAPLSTTGEGLVICHACCDTDECNKTNCYELRNSHASTTM